MAALGSGHLRRILTRPSIAIVIIHFVSDDVEAVLLELAARGATLGLDDLVIAVVSSGFATRPFTIIALFFAPLKVVLVDDALVRGRFLDELLRLRLEAHTPSNRNIIVVDLPREVLVCEQAGIVLVEKRRSSLGRACRKHFSD